MFKANQITKKENLVNSSNFILTINTNDYSESAKDTLERSTTAILNHFDRFIIPKNEAYGIALKNNITHTKAEFSIEKSPKGGYYHCHSLIEIRQKKGIYHVNLELIRKALESQFGYIPYVNVRFFKDASEAVKTYISKGL